jgi:hypothetical protein
MRYRSQADREARDACAFLVVLGISGIIARVASVMYSEGLAGAWVPGLIACALPVVGIAWLYWRLSEYDRIRR